ncbi:MAG: SNF2 helicase associated domain-containing protein, partial [Streptococcus sanguinis]|nr:SNF2 helicase associated domain-containing protein [Streptococcus sanguinis]
MAKLIPGKIRTEGIALVENNKVVILEVSDSLLYARVDECNLRYSLDDDVIFCYCDFFQKKKYCAHLAALEYYLKNAPSGKDVLKSMEEEELTSQETQELVSFGSLFLDKVLPDKSNQQVRYELSATGQEDSYTGQFLWSLRISRLPDERSYVVRDVLSFLRTLEKGGHYQIGKSYYEAIHLEDFDEASQDLLVFLQGLVSDYQGQDSSLIFPNAGRNLFFPASIFEEGVIFLMNLSSFRLEYSLYDYSEVFFQDLHEEAEVYTFQVEEYEEHFELVIAEKNYKMLYDGQFIFYGDTFYQLNPQQIRLMKALRELPIEHDRLKRLQFDLSERTKLASSLSEFKKVGRVEAPESMMIHDFTAKFAFDIGPDKRLILDTVFDYGDRKVTTRKDLERLPFAGNFEHEQQVFKQMLQAGFVADFYSQRPPLKPEEIYHFFSEVIPNFEALGRVSMTEELEALAQTESPRISVKMKGGLLDVGFDFAGIAQSEVDAVLDSLF